LARVRVDPSPHHPDYMIGMDSIDAVIAAIKGEQQWRPLS